jgi:hypothetical protein
VTPTGGPLVEHDAMALRALRPRPPPRLLRDSHPLTHAELLVTARLPGGRRGQELPSHVCGRDRPQLTGAVVVVGAPEQMAVELARATMAARPVTAMDARPSPGPLPSPSVAVLATRRRRRLVPCASRRATSITAPDACRHRLLASSPWEAARRRGAVGERGGRRRRRTSLWRRREREKEEGRVARGADSGRVFTGRLFIWTR